MRSLIITAHPSSKGFVHRIAEAYKKGREDSGHEVEILDLYKQPLQPYLHFEERADMAKPDAMREAMQAKIMAADDLVFIHPMWWVSMPAIMKNFLDVNFAAHFAFRYNSHGHPVGLLKGKTGSVFITCDSPWYIYMLIAMPFESIWRLAIIRFCGLRGKAFKVYYDRVKATPERDKVFLDKVYNVGRKCK
jgi:putative NADPH-quinone reductase